MEKRWLGWVLGMGMGMAVALAGCPGPRCVTDCDGSPDGEIVDGDEPQPEAEMAMCPLDRTERRVAEAYIAVVQDARDTVGPIAAGDGTIYASVGRPLLFGASLYSARGNLDRYLCEGGEVGFIAEWCRRDGEDALPVEWDRLDECEDVECYGDGFGVARTGLTRVPYRLGSESHAVEYHGRLDADTPALVRYDDNPIYETVFDRTESSISVTRDASYHVTATLEDGSVLDLSHTLHLDVEIAPDGTYDGRLTVEIPSAFSETATLVFALSSVPEDNEGDIFMNGEPIVHIAPNNMLVWATACYREGL